MKKGRGLLGIALVGILLNMSSCLDSNVEDPNQQLNSEIAVIDNYLLSVPFSQIVKDPYGIRMEIQQLGTGLPAKSSADSVDVKYKGTLFSNGAKFDEGNIRYPLSSLIDGWKVAFTTLPAGSKAKIYIPSPLGYGSQNKPGSGGNSGIPANSILVFEVTFNEAVTTKAELTKLASDTVALDSYLTGKSINATKDTTGIRYVMTQTGTGDIATWYDKLTLKFTYKLLTDDSKVVATVDQAPSTNFYSRPVDYIHGLKVGLQKLSKGSKATFYIPSGLAFGPQGARDNTGLLVIPANANIIVDVEVTNIAQ